MLQQLRALTEQADTEEVICVNELPRFALRSAPQRQDLWRRSYSRHQRSAVGTATLGDCTHESSVQELDADAAGALGFARLGVQVKLGFRPITLDAT